MSEENLKELFERALWEKLEKGGILYRAQYANLIGSLQLTGGSEIDRCDLASAAKDHAILLEGMRQTIEAAPTAFKSGLSREALSWLRGDPLPDVRPGEILREITTRVESLTERQKSTIRLNVERFFEARCNGNKLPIHWDGLRLRLESGASSRTPHHHLNYFCNYGGRLIENAAHGGADDIKVGQIRAAILEVIHSTQDYIVASCHAKRSQEVDGKLHSLREQLTMVWSKAVETIKNAIQAKRMLTESEQLLMTHTVTQLTEKRNDLRGALKLVEELGILIPVDFKGRLEGFLLQAGEIVSMHEKTVTALDNREQVASFVQKTERALKEAREFSREFGRMRRLSFTRLKQVANRLGRELEELEEGDSISNQQDQELRRAARDLVEAIEDLETELTVQDQKFDPRLIRLNARFLASRKSLAEALPPVQKHLSTEILDRTALQITSDRLLAVTEGILGDLSHEEVGRMEGLKEVPPADRSLWTATSALSEAESTLSIKVRGERHLRLGRLHQAATDLLSGLRQSMPKKGIPEQIVQKITQEGECQFNRARIPLTDRENNLLEVVTSLIRVNPLANTHPELKQAMDSALAALGLTREHERGRGQNFLVELVVAPVASFLEPQDPLPRRESSELEERLLDEPILGVLPHSMLFGARNIESFSDIGGQGEMAEKEKNASQIANRSGLIGEILGIHPIWSEICNSDETRILISEMGQVFTRYGRGFLLRITGSQNPGYLKLTRLNEGFESGHYSENIQESLQEGQCLLDLLTDPARFERLKAGTLAIASMLLLPPVVAEIQGHENDFLYKQREFFERLGVWKPEDFLFPRQELHEEDAISAMARKIEELFPEKTEREFLILHLYHRRLLADEVLVDLLKEWCKHPTTLREEMPGLVNELLSRYKWLRKRHLFKKELERVSRTLGALWLSPEASEIDGGLQLLPIVEAQIEAYGLMRGFSRFFRGERARKEICDALHDLRTLGLAREARLLVARTGFKEG